MNRRLRLCTVIFSAFPLLASPGSHAQSRITITLSPNHPGSVIPDNFNGVSHETSTLLDGETLGGAAIADDATWTETSTSVKSSGGFFILTLAPASAAIAKLTPGAQAGSASPTNNNCLSMWADQQLAVSSEVMNSRGRCSSR
jgi:hypothetical protein